jgi:hypothetical protein
MGHVRVGRLGKSAAWNQVVALLSMPGVDAARVAESTGRAAEGRLLDLHDDPSLGYCFWLLTRLASAARRPEFEAALGRLGLEVRGSDSIFGFVSDVSDRVRDETRRHPESGPFADLAADALTRALAETVGTEGRSLFDSAVADLERALNKHATRTRFADLAILFFGDFLARTLRFYVDKELPNHVGRDGFRNSDESAAFIADLDRYARQSAVIVQDFAGDWFSLHDYESDGAIGRDEAQRFVGHALWKLQQELREPVA